MCRNSHQHLAGGIHQFYLHSTGRDLIICPHLAATETGKGVSDLAAELRAQPQFASYVERGF